MLPRSEKKSISHRKPLGTKMEVKDRISYKLLCNACLCVGHGLNLITDVRLKRFYLDALNEIPMCNIADITPVLCWDCEALLQRAMSFKDQVKGSYQVLLTYTSENLQEDFLSDVSRTPRLTIKTNKIISIIPDETNLEKRESLVKNEPKQDWGCKRVTNLSETPEISKRPDTQQVYLKDDNIMKIEDDGVTNLSETPEISKRPDTQKVYLKEDNIMKIEDDGDCEDSNAHDDSEYVSNAFKIEDLISKKKKKSKKAVKDKGNKKGKKLKTKKVQEPKDQDLKIVTIELSYDEMMLERDKEIMKESYVNSEYKCDSCIMGFNYYKSYKTHLTAKHSVSIGDYSCPVCKTIHASLDSFTGHYKRHMRRYECSICKKRTMDLKVMQQHYYSMHEISLREYKCADCGKLSNSVDAHRYHRESHKARLQCTECDKTFRHRAGLLNHRLAVHEFKNKFPCNICNKVFKWRTSLKRHQDTHENKKSPASSAYCELCGISFSSLCSYQRHMNNSLKHITKDQLRFICDHCNIKFADKTKLRDHIEEKHLHRTFQCSICMKTSKNRVGLDQHIRNVHKGRPNNKMCHHCGKGFPTKVQLESHIRTHTGERPFICEYCPTTFSQQSNLYKHNRQVHLNVKSKRYPTCKKKLDSGPPPDAPMNPPPAVSVVLHYSEAGYLTAEM